MGAVTIFSEPVCVVICSQGVSEEDVRRCLGDAVPLKFTWWADQEYMEAIHGLRPRLIVLAAEEHATDSAALLSSLLASPVPTIATLSLVQRRVRIRQLGANTQAMIRSLDDLLLE